MEVEKYSDSLLFGVLDKGSRQADYGNDLLNSAVEREQEEEDLRTELGQKSFATIDNIDSCVAYIEKALEGLGFVSQTGLSSCSSDSAVLVCNVLYGLLQQRNEDIEARSEANDRIRRLESEKKSLHVQLTKLEKACESKEREIKEMTMNQRKAATESHNIQVKLRSDRDDARKAVEKLTAKDTYFQAEMRKRERETRKLQEKLHAVLMEKKKDTKTGIEIINPLQKESGGRITGMSSSKGQSDDDFTKLVVEAYEARQKELIAENGDLRASLRQLQDDLGAMLTKNSNHVPSLREAVDTMSSLEAEQDEAPMSNDVFNLPYGIAKEEIEQRLRGKIKTLVAQADRLRQEVAGSTGIVEKKKKAVKESLREQELQLELEEARAVIEKQNSMLSLNNGVGACQRTVDSLSQTDNSHCQPTVTRTSHTQTESSDSTDDDNVEAEEYDDDDDGDEEEAARRQRGLALEMKLRHVEEEREAAVVRAHDLQTERQELDHQKQMLEEEQEAFKSALKKWAPGLGAGQFLSKSITRKEQ